MNKVFNIFLILLISVLSSQAVTKISTGTGDWTSAGSWSPAGVPACGDSIVIEAGHTIIVSAQQNYSGCGTRMAVVIRGTLYFAGGNKLRMPCGSNFYVFPGGAVMSDNSGGNANQIEICNNTVWNGSMGTLIGPSCLPPNQPPCSAVLPVTLIAFRGNMCGSGKVCLKWKTASEKYNEYFLVERSSDGNYFEPLFKVASKAPGGTSHRLLEYEAVDNLALYGLNYYRLRQFDIDGGNATSPMIAVDNIDAISGFKIYPNPGNGIFLLAPGSDFLGKSAQIEIRNLLGQLYYYEEIIVTSDHTFTQLNLKELLKGTYSVILRSAGMQYHAVLVVQ